MNKLSSDFVKEISLYGKPEGVYIVQLINSSGSIYSNRIAYIK